MTKRLAVVVQELQARIGEEVTKELSTAISRALNSGFGEILVLGDDHKAVGGVKKTVEMVGKGDVYVYHPSKQFAVSGHTFDMDAEWVYVMEDTNPDNIPDYVKGTKPETQRSFTIESMLSKADAVILVYDGSPGEASYIMSMCLDNIPVYWINPTPGKDSIPHNDGYTIARWILPSQEGG